MKPDITIRARVPKELAARLARIAIHKQATSRAMSSVLREAAVDYVRRSEEAMELAPITEAEVGALLVAKGLEEAAA